MKDSVKTALESILKDAGLYVSDRVLNAYSFKHLKELLLSVTTEEAVEYLRQNKNIQQAYELVYNKNTFTTIGECKVYDLAYELIEYNLKNLSDKKDYIDDITASRRTTKRKLIASNENIKRLVKLEIERLGTSADLNHIDTSRVTIMRKLFYGSKFCGDISKWDTRNVVDMSEMFSFAFYFNCDISNWNTQRVKNMHAMFDNAVSFNRDISSWDVSNVEDFSCMFKHAKSFNQNLTKWEINKNADVFRMFTFSGMTKENLPAGFTGSNQPFYK